MTLKLIPLATAAVAAVALAQAASAETRNYDISGFTQITASSSTNVILKQGPFSIVAETNNGDFEDLKIEKRGDTLIVGRENNRNWIGRSPRYTVTVTAPSIEELRSSSSADISAKDYKFGDLYAVASSSGNLLLSGSCKMLKVAVSSSGDVRASELRCERASVAASSSGDADVYATEKAVGTASSSGDIRFHGKPQDVSKSTSSSGSVKVL